MPNPNATFSTNIVVLYQILTSQKLVATASLLPQLQRMRLRTASSPSTAALERALARLDFTIMYLKINLRRLGPLHTLRPMAHNQEP